MIVLLLDVRQGLTPVDRDIARLLRRSGRHVIVAANKADSPSERHFAHEMLELGFDEPNLISAQHGIGVGDLLDRVLEALPPAEEEAPADAKRRPARHHGPAERRQVVAAQRAARRRARARQPDARYDARPGRHRADLRRRAGGARSTRPASARKSSSRDRLERYSLLRGINAMERADVVLLVIDASSRRRSRRTSTSRATRWRRGRGS